MEAGLFKSVAQDERVSTPSEGQSLPREEHSSSILREGLGFAQGISCSSLQVLPPRSETSYLTQLC
ncbi:hypothetical protein Nmel_015000, partial [Mimus melanotis]